MTLSLNRKQRRALKSNAAAMARFCFDQSGKVMLPVSDPVAIHALERAFTRMLQAGGEPLAIPLSEAEANAFPVPEGETRVLPGGVTWLAVGLDVSCRASYYIQCVKAENRALAHDAAKAIALSRLRASLSEPGFTARCKKATGHA
jgi:hypothetical protein